MNKREVIKRTGKEKYRGQKELSLKREGLQRHEFFRGQVT